MKCLFLCTAIDIGGLETYLLRLITFIKLDCQNEIHVLCKAGRLGLLEKDYQQVGAKLIPMQLNYLRPAGWSKLYRILMREKYDAVCDLTGNFAGGPLLLARQSGCKSRVCFFRSSQEFFKPTALRLLYWRFANRLVLKYATTILSNSEAAFTNFFRGYQWKEDSRFKVIPNGILWSDNSLSLRRKQQLGREFSIPEGSRIIAHVGRYVPAKNHKAILNAARWFLANRPGVVFLLIGREVRQNLSEEVKKRNLANIRFAGERQDVLDLLSSIDAFYFPSVIEGQPNALLEAVASGIPFVASNIAEVRSCFPKWWKEQWLVSPHDFGSACQILDNHLSSDTCNCTEFRKLVVWIRDNNNPQRRFGQVLKYLKAN